MGEEHRPSVADPVVEADRAFGGVRFEIGSLVADAQVISLLRGIWARFPGNPILVTVRAEEHRGDDPKLRALLGDQGAAGFRALFDGFPELVGVLWALRDGDGRIRDFEFGYGNPAMLRGFRIPPETPSATRCWRRSRACATAGRWRPTSAPATRASPGSVIPAHYPVGRVRCRGPCAEMAGLVDAVGVAMQVEGPVGEVGQHRRRHRGVVADEVPLGHRRTPRRGRGTAPCRGRSGAARGRRAPRARCRARRARPARPRSPRPSWQRSTTSPPGRPSTSSLVRPDFTERGWSSGPSR